VGWGSGSQSGGERGGGGGVLSVETEVRNFGKWEFGNLGRVVDLSSVGVNSVIIYVPPTRLPRQ
jgi:hypothetical protein